MRELELELSGYAMNDVEEHQPAVTISCAGMEDYYTVCPMDFKAFIEEYDEVTYVAFDWHNMPNDLEREELDFDDIEAWFESDERESLELLVRTLTAQSFTAAKEMIDDGRATVFNGTDEEYARQFLETSGIDVDALPALVRDNINWDDVFTDIDAELTIIRPRLARNCIITVWS